MVMTGNGKKRASQIQKTVRKKSLKILYNIFKKILEKILAQCRRMLYSEHHQRRRAARRK
jgi:hypothetical protein